MNPSEIKKKPFDVKKVFKKIYSLKSSGVATCVYISSYVQHFLLCEKWFGQSSWSIWKKSMNCANFWFWIVKFVTRVVVDIGSREVKISENKDVLRNYGKNSTNVRFKKVSLNAWDKSKFLKVNYKSTNWVAGGKK